MDTNPLISVVLSFRNEEEVLPELIKRLQKVLRALSVDYELIFINDASDDGSLALLEEHRRDDRNIKIINMSRRFGIASCVLAGFRHARGDAIIYMDCDLQDPPELIPTLIEKWRGGADIVHTTRTKRKGENALKIWLSRMAYRIIHLVADITIYENSGDFKLISRRAMNEILELKESDPFMRGLVAWVGFNQVQVFYEREARFAGRTKFSLWRSINPYKEFVRGLTLFSSLPLYFALVVGFIVSFWAFVVFFYIIISKMLGVNLPGWSALMVTMLFLGGTILFTVGILGIYVGRVHREIKRRPHYIIESAEGIDTDKRSR